MEDPATSPRTPLAAFNSGVRAERRGAVDEAKLHYGHATSKGHPKALHNLAVLTEKTDPEAAVALFRQAAKKGMVEAQYALGMHLKDGRGVEQNAAQAAVHLRRAANKGHSKAHVAMATLLQAGVVEVDPSQDPFEAKVLAQEPVSSRTLPLGIRVAVARLLEAEAWMALGRLRMSHGSSQDSPNAFECFGRVWEESHDPAAAFALSTLYAAGTGGAPLDDAICVQLLSSAAVAGHGMAQYNLACRKLRGQGLESDVNGAIRLLEEAADTGLDKPARTLRRVMKAQRELERKREQAEEDAAAPPAPPQVPILDMRAEGTEKREGLGGAEAPPKKIDAPEPPPGEDPIDGLLSAHMARAIGGMHKRTSGPTGIGLGV